MAPGGAAPQGFPGETGFGVHVNVRFEPVGIVVVLVVEEDVVEVLVVEVVEDVDVDVDESIITTVVVAEVVVDVMVVGPKIDVVLLLDVAGIDVVFGTVVVVVEPTVVLETEVDAGRGSTGRFSAVKGVAPPHVSICAPGVQFNAALVSVPE